MRCSFGLLTRCVSRSIEQVIFIIGKLCLNWKREHSSQQTYDPTRIGDIVPGEHMRQL